MQSFVPTASVVVSPLGSDGDHTHSRFSDIRALEQSAGFRLEDAIDLSRNSVFNRKSTSQGAVAGSIQFGNFDKLASPDITPSTARVGPQRLSSKKGPQNNLVPLSTGHFENWGESTMADASPRTDTSTDVDTDENNQRDYPACLKKWIRLHQGFFLLWLFLIGNEGFPNNISLPRF